MAKKIQGRMRPITIEKRKLKKVVAGPGVAVNGENQEREIRSPRRQRGVRVSIIKEKVEAAGQDNAVDSWKNVSIYRVPQHLRNVCDPNVYTPQVVSLGPYHHGTASLQQMERHKWRALHRVCARTGKGAEIYFESMEKQAGSARACYEPTSDRLPNDKFAEMMLLDGCFILEILKGSASCDGFRDLGYDEKDPVFSMQGLTHFAIQRDMIMLENQIPLSVLNTLLGLQPTDPQVDAVELAIAFFLPSKTKDNKMQKTRKCESISVKESPNQLTTTLSTARILPSGRLHFLDVIRSHFEPESEIKKRKTGRLWWDMEFTIPCTFVDHLVAGETCQELIHCVTKLKDAGIKIKKRVTDRLRNTKFTEADERCQEPIHCATELRDANIKIKKRKTGSLWDIKFENGILHIPPIVIDDGTKSLFFNLIAFEQCHYEKDITSYVVFLDHLINSAEDVKYLHKHGIIEHWLGSDTEVADLINCLCKEVVFDINGSPLSQIYRNINEYYRRPCNAWRATLKRRYFNNPWSIISFVAAVFLLIMTAGQAYFAFYSYYWPAK